jgi:hypothetical protein
MDVPYHFKYPYTSETDPLTVPVVQFLKLNRMRPPRDPISPDKR